MAEETNINFTSGPILGPLLRFAGPILMALLLQAMYGAVDLLIVGQFASSTDVSAVSIGSQIMLTLSGLITSLSMGITILLGEKIGAGKANEGNRIVGSGILMFLLIGVIVSAVVGVFAPDISALMQAPQEAFTKTADYTRICGIGLIMIMGYNLIGSIFRGIGDSKTPLITVAIACVVNILGDLLLIAVLDMGTTGAAYATVFAQGISVIASLLIIRRKNVPLRLSRETLRWDGGINRQILKLGIPLALQETLIGISFLIVLAIVNSLGLVASAGVGVAEKVCGFIMLVPWAFMDSMAAFVAQNRGAGRPDRAITGLKQAIAISTAFGVVMFFLAFFWGDGLVHVFTHDEPVVIAGAEYLKAYAIDCLFTCFLFCFIGFFNGMECTRFVMIQGITGAFLFRVPFSFLMTEVTPVSLFHIGLANPVATVSQILMCLVFFCFLRKRILHK